LTVSALDLTALAERFGLSPAAVSQLGTLGDRLANDPLAPTTVRDPAGVRDDHFADSLVALDLPAVADAGRIVDIGAGAGLPGLALATALTGAHITLVESVGRKCEFIASTAAAMALANVAVVNARAEEFRSGLRMFDVVTARALAPLDVIAEYAAPLLSLGGHLVAWRGQREPQLEAAGQIAADKLGLAVLPPIQVHPYPAAEHRYLHLMLKVRETPDEFPRRPGMARKRPLGGG
jgi:16S rRNA (guanine527-N7)-methyltransferase